jgi:hypothetical protein
MSEQSQNHPTVAESINSWWSSKSRRNDAGKRAVAEILAGVLDNRIGSPWRLPNGVTLQSSEMVQEHIEVQLKTYVLTHHFFDRKAAKSVAGHLRNWGKFTGVLSQLNCCYRSKSIPRLLCAADRADFIQGLSLPNRAAAILLFMNPGVQPGDVSWVGSTRVRLDDDLIDVPVEFVADMTKFAVSGEELPSDFEESLGFAHAPLIQAARLLQNDKVLRIIEDESDILRERTGSTWRVDRLDAGGESLTGVPRARAELQEMCAVVDELGASLRRCLQFLDRA